jgi:hypothetical protein
MKEQLSQVRRTSTDLQNNEPLSDQRRMGAILVDMWQSTEKLLRQELDLAMAHLDDKVEEAKADLFVATTGGAVLYAGVLTLVAACVLALSQVLDPWLSALVVGLAASGLGYGMLRGGTKKILTDSKSQDSAKRDTRMTGLKETTK